MTNDNTQLDIRNDLSRSAKAFQDIVWPRVAAFFDGGELVPVESVTDSEMARHLDVLAGIDAWHVKIGAGMRGIASRIQVGTDWRSFTVRMERDSGAETEYAKRLSALVEAPGRWLFPYLTCQAFLETWDGPLLSAAVARTSDIIACIEHGWHKDRRVNNASFAAVFWNRTHPGTPFDGMQDHGYTVKIAEGAK